jgi:uncharacterized Zn-binding protein involved in type VI secretion
MALPAARLRDLSACPAHGAGLVAQGADSVQANNQPLARASDQCACTAGPADTITTGSATVRANDRPAARVGSKTVHGGNVMTGSANVWVGGPDATLVGPVSAGMASCKGMAQTSKTQGSKSQSWGNCGLETMRSMLNARRARLGLPPITEEEMLKKGLDAGAGNDPAAPWAKGATNGKTESEIMKAEGMPIRWEWGTPENIEAELAKGQPVGARVHPVEYWPPDSTSAAAEHEVLVIGVEHDEHGKIVAYIINDSGIGKCGMRVPAAEFDAARKDKDGKQKGIMVPQEPVY